ncbi:hypothetical protein CPB97_001643 [Podila verticillata]|nr:hypothetical protein CPB97_001643 [Podila verticillata]
MPPKKRPADDSAAGDEARKKAATTTAAGSKSVTIAAPGGVPAKTGPAKTGAARPGAAGTSKTGTVRAAPKPGVRKVNAAAQASRAKAASVTAAAAKKEKETAPPVITKNTLMWFRNDLRLQDNRALHAASVRAHDAGTTLLGVYIITEQEWAARQEAPVKIDFWMRNLAKLRKELEKLSIPLIVKKAGAVSEIPGIIQSIVDLHDITHVFWNAEYTADEQKRDEEVKETITKLPFVYAEISEDRCVIPPKEIMTKIAKPFTVFDQFKMTWLVQVETQPRHLTLSPAPEPNPAGAKAEFSKYFGSEMPTSHPHDLDQSEIEKLYPAGEAVAHERLTDFISGTILEYHTIKSQAGHLGSNPLAPYIANGILSHRQCVSMARSVNNNKVMVGNEGVKLWVTEIIWKEFFKHVMVSFPRICENMAFLPATDDVRWSNDDRKFTLWCQGKTGYPIVDAGMRQLNTVGYMDSRVRKIVQCFLVKDLMVSWQKGEKYFMSHLIDGEMASVNGSWQWCAATGADSQPYISSNNPVTQSQKYDPHGQYISRWVPELEGLSDNQVHDPFHVLSAKDFGKLGYARPMVDHTDAKKKYVDEFKRVLNK